MYKRIIAIICVVLSLTVFLCACDDGDSDGGSRRTSKNEYKNYQAPEKRTNELTLTIMRLYWEDGELYMKMALVCDTQNTAHDIYLEELVLESIRDDEVIAKAGNIELEDITVEPGETIYWTYCFEEDEIVTPDADLRMLKSWFDYSYSH